MVNVSIVIYKSSWKEIEKLISVLNLEKIVNKIFIIDNSPYFLQNIPNNIDKLNYKKNDKNLGYGAAHNVAIQYSIDDGINYHVILNPDIQIHNGDLDSIFRFVDKENTIGLIMPKIIYNNRDIQYLCKLLPTPFDLFIRRFLYGSLKKIFQAKLDRYELKHKDYNSIMNVPSLSGCFMFCRTEALKKVNGFDERFFMYLEDVDLTRRIAEYFKTVYYPLITIKHEYRKESYKSFKLLKHHIISAIKYFNKWGWFFDKKRKIINSKLE